MRLTGNLQKRNKEFPWVLHPAYPNVNIFHICFISLSLWRRHSIFFLNLRVTCKHVVPLLINILVYIFCKNKGICFYNHSIIIKINKIPLTFYYYPIYNFVQTLSMVFFFFLHILKTVMLIRSSLGSLSFYSNVP